MNHIHILAPQVANKIAAGEVIERPASIVKELIENSIDAGSTSVTVEISGGGIDMIRVTDNGTGIASEDAVIAFERHATSKLMSSEDLNHIITLGFRGEALASIAAVSQVELLSRTQDAEHGVFVVIHGGELQSNKPYGCPDGTSIIVKNLFYNTPARLKFLKKQQAEAAYVDDYVAKMILSNPHISFKFINNGTLVYHSPGNGDLKTAVFCIYGKEILPVLKEVSLDNGYIRITGFAGKSEYSRNSRVGQSFFVNGRYIRSLKLSEAVQNAYDTRMMTGRFPFCVLHLTLASSEVDVNVHPNKLEVRFKDEARVLSDLNATVHSALENEPLRKSALPLFGRSAEFIGQSNSESSAGMQTSVFKADPSKETEAVRQDDLQAKPLPELRVPANASPLKICENSTDNDVRNRSIPNNPIPVVDFADKPDIPSVPMPKAEDKKLDALELPFEIIGQVFSCYWIIQQGEDLFIIDQHAAHERKLYDEFMEGVSVYGSQQLISPILLHVAPLEAVVLNEHIGLFGELGFELNEFGPQTYAVRAVPHLLGEPQTEKFFMDILDSLSALSKTTSANIKREQIIQTACKHAVKAGAQMDRLEIAALLQQLNKASPPTCPHGRPIIVRLSQLDFEKMFKRVL